LLPNGDRSGLAGSRPVAAVLVVVQGALADPSADAMARLRREFARSAPSDATSAVTSILAGLNLVVG
jgi:hypothetical protein